MPIVLSESLKFAVGTVLFARSFLKVSDDPIVADAGFPHLGSADLVGWMELVGRGEGGGINSSPEN